MGLIEHVPVFFGTDCQTHRGLTSVCKRCVTLTPALFDHV
ncbi:Hypothetical protein RAK1035_1882 [Roseovarius sp. AK1035]|nr:Hypothetical protein RAK1035_1882 [Roseovarius sp. AK1035]